MLKEYMLVGAVACATCYLSAPFCRVIAIKLGAVAEVRDRDVHTTPTPYLGGAAIYLGFLSGYLVAASIPGFAATSPIPLSDVRVILTSATILFLLGLFDDVLDLGAYAKLAGQISASAVLVAGGIQIYVIPLPGGSQFSLGSPLGQVVTILFFLAVVNAVNMIDGLDGLATGVVCAGAISLLVRSQVADDAAVFNATLISVILVGVCLGFYVHNAPPARMFMGDAGSLLLGGLLTASIILSMQSLPSTGSPEGEAALGVGSRIGVFLWVALPVAIAGIPLLDLGLAMIRRFRTGTGIFAADKHHLHHVLVRDGRSPTVASVLLTGWSAIVSIGAAWVVVAPSFWKVLAIVAAAALLLGAHERSGSRSRARRIRPKTV